MIAAVILAAGASSRMGTVKALLPLDGETLVARIIRLARQGGASTVVVVLGPPHGQRIAAALPADVLVAWNEDPSRGMLSSVQAALPALAALRPAVVGTLIWPVDVPLVAPLTVRQLLGSPLTALTAPCYHDRGGHPLWLPASLFADVQALEATASLRQLRQKHPMARLAVDDPGVLRDLDTPDEFAQVLAERHHGGPSGGS